MGNARENSIVISIITLLGYNLILKVEK